METVLLETSRPRFSLVEDQLALLDFTQQEMIWIALFTITETHLLAMISLLLILLAICVTAACV